MKIHKEGRVQVIVSFAIICLLNGLLLCFHSWKIVTYIVLAISVFLAYMMITFYRDPKREIPNDKTGYVNSPNDGKVVAVERIFEKDHLRQDCVQVSVYMTFFNSHCNWVPVSGIVTHVSHEAGNFHRAFLPKSSTENEHSNILIETHDGHRILTKQIAGAYARRVVTYVKDGETVTMGEPLGFIKLGSRMDIFVPAGSEILVKIGDKVRANKTFLAHLPEK